MFDLIGVVSETISLTKKLLELKAVASNAEAKMLVAEVNLQLAELKSKLADLMNENTQLKQDLKKAMNLEVEVALKNGLYYKPDGDGPFCTNCYDNHKKVIRVVKMGEIFRDLGKWRCGSCTTKYM